LITPLPAAPLSLVVNSSPVTIPYWADGSGYTNTAILMNATDQAISGSVQFLLSTGFPAALTVNGSAGNAFPYSIPSRTLAEFATGGGMFQTGSIRIIPTNNTSMPAAFSVLSYKPSTITNSEAVFAAGTGTQASRMYVESGTNLFGGLAVANLSPALANATF